MAATAWCRRIGHGGCPSARRSPGCVRRSTTAHGGEREGVELRAVTEGRTAAGARRLEATGAASPGRRVTVWERPLSARWGPCEGGSEVRVQGSPLPCGAIGFPSQSALRRSAGRSSGSRPPYASQVVDLRKAPGRVARRGPSREAHCDPDQDSHQGATCHCWAANLLSSSSGPLLLTVPGH